MLTSVLDDHNRPAPDLPREAFQIFEEGVEQKLAVFESETQQPLDLALMIDASLSAHKEISFEEEAAAHFIRQVLRPGDRLSVFSVGEDVTQLAGFSDNVGTLEWAVHRMPAGSETSLYDAILLASRQLERRGEDRRRVIILVTDAGETTSYADFDAARKGAVKSGALLYTIVVRPVKNESGRNTAGEHALETITDTMGGAMFYPDSYPGTRRHLRSHQPRAAHAIPPGLLSRASRTRQHLPQARSQSRRQLPGPPPQNLPHRPAIKRNATHTNARPRATLGSHFSVFPTVKDSRRNANILGR